jgi:hypothetical protein
MSVSAASAVGEVAMSEPHPASVPVLEPQRGRPPWTVRWAVGFMYAGAALEMLAMIIALVTTGSLQTAIFQLHPGQPHQAGTPGLHATELIWTTLLVVQALIALCLWLWMAWANEEGRDWARGSHYCSSASTLWTCSSRFACCAARPT